MESNSGNELISKEFVSLKLLKRLHVFFKFIIGAIYSVEVYHVVLLLASGL